MALFKTTEEIQTYIKVNVTNKVASIVPYVNDAQNKFIRQYLGETLLKKLDAWYQTLPLAEDAEPDPLATEYAALLPYVQNALAKFTLYLAIPSLDVQITESGMAVIQNANLVPASKDRVAAMRDSVLQMGYDNIETLLRFLEENKDDYDDWTDSDAYTINTGLFVNSADEFNKYVNIDNSRMVYMRLQQTIQNVELLYIEPAISKEMCDDIKAEIAANNISAKYLAILPHIKRSVANYTIAYADIDTANLPNNNAVISIESNKADKYRLLGETFMISCKKILDASPSTYPLYEASDAYDSANTDYTKYDNTAESTNYVFGG